MLARVDWQSGGSIASVHTARATAVLTATRCYPIGPLPLAGMLSPSVPFAGFDGRTPMLRKLRQELNDYWPTYLAHHTHRKNRALHDLGDLAVLASLLTFNPLIVPIGVALGYGFAFTGHYFVEGRRPATLEHPVLAGLSNWRMFALGCAGKIEAELERFGLESEGEARFGIEFWRANYLHQGPAS
ncbi:MAG: DUF962 domain-containing protein [Myxococcota bacterium]